MIESLIVLFLSLLVFIFSMECFSSARKHFIQLKRSEESNMGAFSALDRMKSDLLDAGLGLIFPMRMGVLEGVTRDEEWLVILSKDSDLTALGNLVAGQTRVQLENTKGINKGREVCLFDADKGECHTVSSVAMDSIVLASSLQHSYQRERVHFVLLRKISLFLDESSNVIRRKVNASSAQPLLEEVARFAFDHNSQSNLVRLSLSLEEQMEKNHEILVFPKNTALASLD